MGYVIGLFLLVVGSIIKRLAIPAIIIGAILVFGGGAVASATGGQFWPACKIIAEVCGIGAVIALVSTACYAISTGFR